ncbi:MAG: ATP-binding cassette domain-containing protein [Rhodospirillaceae bacterium]|nr:ATP-binding cassette domain-containing protein [Rhodospirillaceae bacterium]
MSAPADAIGTEPKIELRGLKKAFGAKTVLDGIDLSVGEGESVVIIGGSGTGKSVMLKCILGLLWPDAGSICIDGMDVSALADRTRQTHTAKIGMLFQGSALFDSLTVWENVAFALRSRTAMSRSEAREIALGKLAQVGLGPDVADLSPAELSGGMQRRVALARAIATDPEIVFFDEPTAGLDPILGDIINRLIVDCVRHVGATAVSITHDMTSARKIADRIAMLHDGRIIWDGPAGDIDSSGNAFVDQFIHGRAEGPIGMAVRR